MREIRHVVRGQPSRRSRCRSDLRHSRLPGSRGCVHSCTQWSRPSKGSVAMTFSLELPDDVIHVRDWVHEFAVEVVRPAAAEWDEREETPWPIIQEAAKVGLYSMEMFATQVAEPSGLGMLTVFEEMFWGDAGIALSILGTGLAAASLSATGTPEQTRRVAAADVRHSSTNPCWPRSVRRSRAPAPTSARSSPAPAMTRHPTSGFSTAPRPGPPTVESPTSTSSSRRCIPNWARADRPPSSSRRTHRASPRARSSRSTASAPRTPPRWCSTTSGFRAG